MGRPSPSIRRSLAELPGSSTAGGEAQLLALVEEIGDRLRSPIVRRVEREQVLGVPLELALQLAQHLDHVVASSGVARVAEPGAERVAARRPHDSIEHVRTLAVGGGFDDIAERQVVDEEGVQQISKCVSPSCRAHS